MFDSAWNGFVASRVLSRKRFGTEIRMKQKIKESFSRWKKVCVQSIQFVKKSFYRCYENSKDIARRFFQDMKPTARKFFLPFVAVIQDNYKNGRSRLMNIAGLATGAIAFVTYLALTPALAQYQKVEGARKFSNIAMVFVGVVAVWELLCVVGYRRLRRFAIFLRKTGESAADKVRRYCPWLFITCHVIFALLLIMAVGVGLAAVGVFRWLKQAARKIDRECPWIIKACVPVLLVSVVIVYYWKPEVTYCTLLTEIYGMPSEAGQVSDKVTDMEGGRPYWKIEEYPRRRRMTLTYMEPYGQPELMGQYSSAYGMAFFQPSARIEVEYQVDQSKYGSMSQEAFEAARGNGFREPVEISYYNSGNRLTLRMEKNSYGKFEITRYSSRDVPQLFNSVLLRIPEGKTIENDLTSQQIEVTFYPDGRPKTRRLSPYIYNLYGVNGEYYAYDENGYLSSLYFLDINGEYVCNKLGIMRIDFQYEDNGNLHSIRYYSDGDREKKTEGFQGVFCERFSYDAKGRLFERYQLDRNENLRSDVNGVCMYRYQYRKEDGKLEQEKFLGFNGEAVRDRRFYGTYVSFDIRKMEEGERAFIVSTDVLRAPFELTDGFVVADGSMGISGGASGQNGQGTVSGYETNQQVFRDDPTVKRRQELAQIVFTGQPDSQTGYMDSMAQYEQQYEMDILQELYNRQSDRAEDGTVRNDAWIQVEDEADVACHYAAVYYVIDKKGDISSVSYCDRDGNLVENEEGYAVKYFDSEVEAGRLIEREWYCDANGRPCLTADGYMAVKTTYESRQDDGNKRIEYLDGSGHEMFSQKLGYARIDYQCELEDRRKTVYRRYFDQEGNSVRIPKQGYAEVRQYYNERNFLVWEAYYDEQGYKMRRADYGVAEIWYEYDDSGNLIRESYKDVDGGLVNRSDTGYAVVYRKFEDGQMVHCHYGGYQDGMFGQVADKVTGVAGTVYMYDGGQKSREEYYDAEGNLTLRSDLGCAVQQFEYDDSGNKCAEYYYGTDRQPILRQDTGYAAVKYQNDEEGKRNDVRFYGLDGLLTVSEKNHCAGINYEYDEKANRVTIKYIGTDGGLMVRGDLGYAKIELTYDSYGNVESGTFWDENEEPILNQDVGYFMFDNTYIGRLWTETRYYDYFGCPVLHKDTGYAQIRNEYSDIDGRLLSQSFYDVDGQPVVSKKYGCARMTFTYDGFGNLTETRYYDANDRLACRSDLGYAMRRSEYDGFGQCVYNYYYGEDGSLSANTTYRCAGFMYKYGNNQVKISYIGSDGGFMMRHDLGYAAVVLEYDNMGNVIRESYFDQNDEPTVGTQEGYAVCESRYDGANCIEKRFLDTQGQVTFGRNVGYAIVRYQYDDQGRCVAEQYYDADDQPVISQKYQCGGRKFAYDKKGNRTDTWYVGLDGEPVCRRDLGHAHAHSEYDGLGNQTHVSYFDAKEVAMAIKGEGYASCRMEYDNMGNCVERRYFDTQGSPVLCGDGGYASIRFVYDDYGQCVSESYFGTEGQPVISRKYQSANREFAYDSRGNNIETTYIGLNGMPLNREDYGYAEVRWDYDAFGNEVEVSYYDGEGQAVMRTDSGFAFCQYEYDVSGNRVKECYYDTEHSLVCRKDEGFAVARHTYNGQGQLIGTDYLGTDEQPIMNIRYHCFGCRYEYDEKGNQRMLCYVDGNGEPAARVDLGYAYVFTMYDGHGNKTCVEYMDAAGVPTAYGQRGYSRVDYDYDSQGNCVEARYCDEPYHLVALTDGGYAKIEYEYDEFGQCIFKRYYDATGKTLAAGLGGSSAGVEYEYNERGDNTCIWYYDVNGEVAARADMGIAMNRRAYDDYGNMIVSEYFTFNPEDDGEMELAVRKDYGYAVMEDCYDGPDWVERRHFDVSGNSVVSSYTDYAVCKMEYNDARQLDWWAYYDAQGCLTIPENKRVAMNKYIFGSNGDIDGWIGYDQYGQRIEESSYIPGASSAEGSAGVIENGKRKEIRIKERQW